MVDKQIDFIRHKPINYREHKEVMLESLFGCVLVKQYSDKSVMVRQCCRKKGSTTSPSKPAINMPIPVATATNPSTNSRRGNSYDSVNICSTLAYIIPMMRPAKNEVNNSVDIFGRKRYQAAKRQNTRILTSITVSSHNFRTMTLEMNSCLINETKARYDLPMNSPKRNNVM